MLVCDEHKFIFLRNPKTASRSVSKALSENFNVRQVGLYHNWKIPKDLVGYFAFMVVRNPYVRAVSGWQHWEHGHNIDFDEWIQEIIQPHDAGLSHEGRLSAVLVPRGRHWRKQTEILDEIGQDIHLVRYEKLEEDLNLLSFMGNIVLPFIGVQDYGDWRIHYTPEIEAIIYQTCKEDFERLGYKRWHFDKRQISLL